ncbi:MAG: DNRLRE domain-containing protein [Candidatus Hodarchaeales archaeon]
MNTDGKIGDNKSKSKETKNRILALNTIFIVLMISILIFFSYQSISDVSGDSATFNPSKDAYILSGGPVGNENLNYGLSNTLSVGYSGAGYRYHSLIHFNLDSIAGASITSATLRLNISDFSGISWSCNYNIHCINDNWDESTVTWSNSVNDYNSTPETFFHFDWSSLGWYEIDLNDTVQDWVSGDVTNLGLRIVHNSSYAGGRHYDFDSSEGLYSPELVIEYLPAASEGNYIIVTPVILVAVLFYNKRRK